MRSIASSHFRCPTALLVTALLFSGCSGSSDSGSGANELADVSTNEPTTGSTGDTNELSDSSTSDTNEPTDNSPEGTTSNSTDETTDPSNASGPETTRVTFNITVPVYVSNALQVRLTWGDKDINASWVEDETWVAEVDFPVNVNNPLVVMFNDSNGAVALGSVETDFKTGLQAMENYAIAANDFNTAKWDDDGDGYNNLNELLAGTNPQGLDAPVAVSATLTLVPDKTIRINWQASPRADYYRVFESPDGLSASTLVSIDLDASTVQFDHSVPLHKRTNAKYIVQACNAIGCTDSTEPLALGALDNGLTLLQANHTEIGDSFGSDIAISDDGQTVVVSAPREDSAATGVNGDPFDNSLSDAISSSYLAGTGAAYVFARINGQWQQQAYLKASNTGRSDHFGTALSISADGNTIAVGAYGESSSATGIDGNQSDDSAIRAGAVYVYVRNNGVWTQQAYVKASNTQTDNYFGRAVSLSADGNTLAVGAHDEKNESTEINGDQTQGTRLNRGAIYMYSRQNSLWTQQAYLKAKREGSDICCFGGLGRVLSLSADGKTLAAGMQYRTERAIVFTQIDGNWQQTATIESPNRQLDGDFGEKLELSADGKTLAITAVGEVPFDAERNRIDGAEEGVAYVYALVDGAWQEQSYFYIDEHPNGRRFGLDVSLSGDGDTLVVSFNGNRLYVYTRADATWSLIARLPDTSTIPALTLYRPRLNGNGDTLATSGGYAGTDVRGVFLF